MDTDPAGAPRLASVADPLEVGTRVRVLHGEPVFASDPVTGDVGTVVEASDTSYLVHWRSGAETWMARDVLERTRAVDPAPEATAARPAPRTLRGSRYLGRYGSLAIFILFTARAWAPGVSRAIHHPTARSIALIALALVVIVAGVVWGTRQAAASRAARAGGRVAYGRSDAEEVRRGQEAGEDFPGP